MMKIEAVDWKNIIVNEWTYIPLMFWICVCAFDLGLLIAWLF